MFVKFLITNYCNNSCPYCFANSIKGERQDMTLRDFAKALQFVLDSGERGIRIMGGEPTTHSQFHEIMYLLADTPPVNSVHILTNGLFDDRAFDAMAYLSMFKPVIPVINVNSVEIIGTERTKILEQNLKRCVEQFYTGFSYNIYKAEQDITEFADILNRYRPNYVRWSLTAPNYAHPDPEAHFKPLIPTALRFVEMVGRFGIDLVTDCVSIPLCVLGADTAFQMMLHNRFSLGSKSVCDPPIDILPDLSVIRCYCVTEPKVKLDDFANLKEIEDYFLQTVDRKASGMSFEMCATCPTYQNSGRSCPCLAFARSDWEGYR